MIVRTTQIEISKRKNKIKKKKILRKKVEKSSSLGKKAESLTRISDELIEKGRRRGFITYDEILKTFPDIENNILFLDVLSHNNQVHLDIHLRRIGL